MLGVDPRSLAVGWFLVVIAIASLGAEQTAPDPYAETIKRALELLPRQPAQVLVVDVTRSARAVDAHGRRVEAFVRHGEDVVYLIAKGTRCNVGRREQASLITCWRPSSGMRWPTSPGPVSAKLSGKRRISGRSMWPHAAWTPGEV
jgi:hypothetical protein